jgi:hypothetical protein
MVTRMETLRLRSAAALAAIAAVWLCACGTSATPDAATATPNKIAQKAKKPANPVDASVADMSSAVSVTKAVSAVQLKFELKERPSPGTPVELDVALIPMDPALAHVSAKFEGEAGLQLVDAGDSVSVDKPPPGIPIKRTITVLPQADGIYTLHAMVTASSDGDSRTTSFAVPVIAGAGLQDPPAKAAATASANAAKTR